MKIFVIRYVLMIGILAGVISLTACSFQVGVDWVGQSAKDNRSFTDKAVK